MEHKKSNFTDRTTSQNAHRSRRCISQLYPLKPLSFILFIAVSLFATAAIAAPTDRLQQKKDAILNKLTSQVQLSAEQQESTRDLIDKKYHPQDCEDITSWKLRKQCVKSMQGEFDIEFITLLSERQKELYDDTRNARKSSVVRGLARHLDLSPTQRKSVREIISRNQEVCKNMDPRQKKQCRSAIRQKTTLEISEILDQEQRDAMEDLVKRKSLVIRY